MTDKDWDFAFGLVGEQLRDINEFEEHWHVSFTKGLTRRRERSKQNDKKKNPAQNSEGRRH